MTDLVLPDLPLDSLVSVDTETSGLFVDDGARVSVVSIAWYPNGATPGNPNFVMPQREALPTPGQLLPRTAVFAFDQGYDTPLGPKDLPPGRKRGKRRQVESLFDDNIDAAPNLDPHYYIELMQWLESMSLVPHNAKFDLHMLAAGLRGYEHKRHLLPDLSRNIAWDTMVVCPVLWPEFPMGLDPTSIRLFGEGKPDNGLKSWLKKNDHRYDLAPWSMLEPYAGDDASKALRLYDVQQLVIDSGEAGDPTVIREICEREIDLAITLYRMEDRGLGIDADAVLDEAEKISGMIERVMIELRAEIIRAFPKRYGSRPVPAVTEHLMRQLWYNQPDDPNPGLGLFPSRVTDKGIPSVTLEVVEELAKDNKPFARHYQILNSLETALSMWYGTWPRLAGPPAPHWHPKAKQRLPRLRTSFKQGRTHTEKGGTISGRLAVERVQLHAIPHDYQIPEGVTPLRRFLKADPGYELWEIDLSQAEYRTAAGISNCTKMKDIFRSGGGDVHTGTCELIFKTVKGDPEFDFHRQVSKRLNFGMIYGAGAQTVRQQIKQFTGRLVPLEELEEWLAVYRATYPELRRKARQVQRQVERTRTLTLAGGRTRWFAPYEEEHKAFNQLVQGGVAEMMKVAMIDIEAERPGHQLLQIHDSLVLEVAATTKGRGTIEFARDSLERTFTQAFDAPFKTDVKKW